MEETHFIATVSWAREWKEKEPPYCTRTPPSFFILLFSDFVRHGWFKRERERRKEKKRGGEFEQKTFLWRPLLPTPPTLLWKDRRPPSLSLWYSTGLESFFFTPKWASEKAEGEEKGDGFAGRKEGRKPPLGEEEKEVVERGRKWRREESPPMRLIQ